MKTQFWSEEEKNELTKLAAKGYTGSRAAEALQEMFPARKYTRSMIGGQASRMGLAWANKKGASREKKKVKTIKAPAAMIPKLVIPMTITLRPVAVLDPTKHCTIFELTASKCRYPMWPDTGWPDPHSLYCGGRVSEKPYCEIHNNIVLRQPNREPSGPFIVKKLPANPEKSTTR